MRGSEKPTETFVVVFFNTKEKKNMSVRPKLCTPPPSYQDTSAFNRLSPLNHSYVLKAHSLQTHGNLKTKM